MTTTVTLSLPSPLAAQMGRRIKQLDTDRSKYIRNLVRRDLESVEKKGVRK